MLFKEKRNSLRSVLWLIAICTLFLSSCEKIKEEKEEKGKYPTKEELDKRYASTWTEYQIPISKQV